METENFQLKYQNSETEKLNKTPDDSDTMDLVLNHVGGFRLGQKLLFLAAFPFGLSLGFNYVLQIFITATPQNHWCRIPELANLSMELRRNLSAPSTIITGDWDHCMTFEANWTQVLETLIPPSAETPTIPCKYGWEFELSDIPYETVTTERMWVCDRASYVPTAMSSFFVGSIVGTYALGWIADRFGRVPAIIAANVGCCMGGFGTIFTRGVWDFVICRFISGLSHPNSFQIMYILVQEYVGPQYRTLISNILAILSAFGTMLCPWIAYFIADWRILLSVTMLPVVIGILIAMFLLPESTRWLVTKGHTKKAVAVLKRFEVLNKTKIPDDVLNDFIISTNKQKLNDKQSILNVLGSLPLRKTMISLISLYLGNALVFDGLMRLLDTFGLNLFAALSVTSVTDIVTLFLITFTLDKFGRRNSVFSFYAIGGVLLLVAIFVPKGLCLATLTITSRFFVYSCATATLQWSSEILPTTIRASGSSLLLTISSFPFSLTSFIVYSERLWSKLPILIFTIVTFSMMGITLTLPETKGLLMPQNIADSEKIIQEKSLCGKPVDEKEGP